LHKFKEYGSILKPISANNWMNALTQVTNNITKKSITCEKDFYKNPGQIIRSYAVAAQNFM